MPHRESGSRPAPRPRPTRRLAIAGAAAAAVVLGGTAAAHAADSPGETSSSPSASPSVSASGSASPSPSGRTARKPLAPPAPHPHLDGVVLARSGSQITITDPEGFRRTLRVTASTRYADGLTSSVAVGTRIHAEGVVDADHTTLDATSIGAAPTPPAGGPGARPGREPVGPRDPKGAGPGRGGPTGGPGRSTPPAAPSPQPTASGSSSAATRS